jgi:acetyl esterase/lipase
MTYDYEGDRRLDPRISRMLAKFPAMEGRDFADRETLLEVANSDKALEMSRHMAELERSMITPILPPLDGLREWREDDVEVPSGQRLNFAVTRPDTTEVVPLVYYIHGGGMATLSTFGAQYAYLAREVARHGVAVVRVDFRNCVSSSSVAEVAPYPAGLQDCVNGLDWALANADRLGLDTSRVVVTGESGGGNLTLALGLSLLQEGRAHLVSGLFAMCPYIAGQWPDERYPSSIRNNGILLNLNSNFGRVGYGIEAFEAKDPLAWPGFATEADVTGLPTTVISVNECDPLCDEGLEFYRLLLRAGVPARARVLAGTTHAIELFPYLCPEITADTAREIAAFAQG